MAPAPRIWEAVPCDEARSEVVAQELGLSSTTARLLCARELGDLDEARRFLAPSLSDLHDPFLLKDMAPAVERILGAIARRERIAIHGDYDVDGVTSTVILRRALELLGADVIHFIPERMRDGYGLQAPALDRLHADGVKLVISVDCGIRADAGRSPCHVDRSRAHHHRSSRARRRAPTRARGHQSETPRLCIPGQASGGSWRRAEARAGAVPQVRARKLVAGIRESRGDRHAGGCRAIDWREPGHRETWTRNAVGRPP